MIESARIAARDAVSQLRRDVVSAAFITTTIAVGVAASVAIFTVARGVLFRRLPYRDPESLVALREFQPVRGLDPGAVAFANLPRYRAMPEIQSLTAFSYSEAVVSGETDAERVIAGNVDGALFETLGTRPAIGRGIERSDEGDRPARVVVLSDGLWHRRFGGDSAILGRSILVDGEPSVVVGVAGAEFEFPRNPSMDRDVGLWQPRRPPPPMMLRRGGRDLTALVRVRPGVSRRVLETRLAATAAEAERNDAPLNTGWRVRAADLRDLMVGRVKSALALLSTCVGALLLIACANASAAMLARTAIRRPMYGVRLALGGSASQVIGIPVVESVLLGAAALILAIPVGAIARSALLRIAPVAVPRQDGITWTWTVTLFAAGIAITAALLSALASIAWVRRLDCRSFLDGSRGWVGSRGRSRALAAFVGIQAALGSVLLGATVTLCVRYLRVHAVQTGFDTSGVTTATIPLRGPRYRDPSARRMLTNELLARVRALPEVKSAAVASLMPLSGGLMSTSFTVRGVATDSSASAALRAVSPGFFETLGIAIRLGRPIAAQDGAHAPFVAVVNEAFVRQSLHATSPLGAIVTLSPPGTDSPQNFMIVGVVSNAKERDLESADSPIIYLSDAQASFPHVVIAFRARGTPPIVAVRRALRDLDPSLALDDPAALQDKVRATYALQFFQFTILSVFAASALLLVAIGIHGAVSFVANSDERATAIRLALGASPRHLAATFFGRTARWSAWGCIAGIVLFGALMPAFGLPRNGPNLIALGVATAVVLCVALLATSRPAARAMRIDALRALDSY